MTTMVSLISEQTVPNILAIWHFQPERLLFVSTEKMEREQKVRDILATVNCRLKKTYKIGENTQSIIVLEDSLLQCLRKLEEWIQGKEDERFIINLTGGTKLMSIAVFEFFKNYESKMIYIPINKNEYISPFPIRSPKQPKPLADRLTVDEYLRAYGLVMVNPDKVKRCIESANRLKEVTYWMADHYPALSDLMACFGQQLRDKRDKKSFSCVMDYNVKNQEESAFFERFHFRKDGNTYSKPLTKDEIGYLTGGWLEDYCFHCVAALQGKGVDDVVLNINIRNAQGRENEFDIIFTAGNALYTIECKSLEQYHDKKFDVLYKIGALQREFGLRVQSFLVTTYSQIIDKATGQIMPHIQERAEQFQTQIIGLDHLMDLKTILEKRLSR
jgi:hypothetical protein